jgi:predicted MFS family arabinose efflux permease
MTPPRLVRNRSLVSLNIATLLIYCGIALMFFLVPFDLIDRRGVSPAGAGAAFLPLSLAIGLLSRPLGAVADKIGPRLMLIVGPAVAALAFIWLGLGQQMSLLWGVLAPLTLVGLGFAVLVAPLTATVLSSVNDSDEGLASGLNNAASRVAQLAGIALAAGIGSFASGYWLGLTAAAALSVAGSLVITARVPSQTAPKHQ